MVKTNLGLIVAISFSISITAHTGDPPDETDIAQSFAATAPALFEVWLGMRQESLQQSAHGHQGNPGKHCAFPNRSMFFEFIACTDTKQPELIGMDVRKTESLLTPYLGILYVEVSVDCVSRRVVPPGRKWGKKYFDKIASSCLDHTLEECLQAGGKRPPPLAWSSCPSGPETAFDYEATLDLTFLWSLGKWEFESETPQDGRTRE